MNRNVSNFNQPNLDCKHLIDVRDFQAYEMNFVVNFMSFFKDINIVKFSLSDKIL